MAEMPQIVFLLCALTSVACAALLLRGWQRQRVRLLLWSGLCFVGFALNNILLIAELWLRPSMDMAVLRAVPALAGLAILLYGLVWDTH